MDEAFLHLPERVFTLLAAGLPAIDGPYLVQLVSRALHIMASIILVGGLFYIRSILSPAGVEACFADRRAVWARWVAVATLLLLVTGIYNFMAIKNQVEAAGEELPSTYHALFGIKFLLGLLVMFLAAMLAGKTSLAEKFRGNMSKWLQVAWLAAMAIVVIGAMLRTFH